MMKRIAITGLMMLAVLAGCSSEVTLPADEAASFAAEVDDMSENLLAAVNSGDYTAYIRDMEAAMAKVSTRADFENLRTLLTEKVGKYESRQMTRVLEQQTYRAVLYDARFEKEDHVTVRVVFTMAETPPLISGLWFDSPALRQK